MKTLRAVALALLVAVTTGGLAAAVASTDCCGSPCCDSGCC
jgi:hypothetical protein